MSDVAKRIAQAEVQHQMSRPLTRHFIGGLTNRQRELVRAMLFNSALYGIEAWEKARPVRERDAFYSGASQ